MIDKRLYQETFSHLRASDQAKQEVFQKMQEMKHRKRMPRVLAGRGHCRCHGDGRWPSPPGQ